MDPDSTPTLRDPLSPSARGTTKDDVEDVNIIVEDPRKTTKTARDYKKSLDTYFDAML